MFFLWFVDWQLHRFLLTSSGPFPPSLLPSLHSFLCHARPCRAVWQQWKSWQAYCSWVMPRAWTCLQSCCVFVGVSEPRDADWSAVSRAYPPHLFILCSACSACVCASASAYIFKSQTRICSAYLTSVCDICIGLCDYGPDDSNDLIVSSVWQLSCF